MIKCDMQGKDVEPIKTVLKIQNIFSQLNIATTTEWLTPVENMFSVHLKIVGTSFYSNGKGTSEYYALASAYGEMIERLQNLLSYRISNQFEKYNITTSFKIDPSEVMTSSIDELRTQVKYLKKIFSKGCYQNNVKYWNSLYVHEDILNQKFISIYDKNDYIHIPELMLDIFYGSNGMAAGNTYSEAFVQAVSEICERYAVKQVIKEKLTPPDITEEIYSRYPDINNLVNSIQNENNHIIYKIKDINLGVGFPVYAVIYIEKNTGKYYVNFGAHPNAKIGIERCITELYQGQSDVVLTNTRDLATVCTDEEKNMHDIFASGDGDYPHEFFGTNPSYKKINLNKMNFYTNHDMCKFYIDLFEKLKYKIYYQDVGFLGFPSLHVVVPGMSEIVLDVENKECATRVKQCENFTKKFEKLDILSCDEIHSMIDFLEHNRKNVETSLNDILDIPIEVQFNHFNDITLDLFLSILYIKLRNYEEGKKYLNCFIQYIKRNGADSKILNYYQLINNILLYKIKCYSDKEIIKRLRLFFDEEFIALCLEDISSEHIFDGIPQCDCQICDKCLYFNKCKFKANEKLINKLLRFKETYKNEDSLVDRLG